MSEQASSSEYMYGERLKYIIERAKVTALHESELELIKDEQDELVNALLRGAIDVAQYSARMEELNEQTGAVRFEDPAEFKQIFRILGVSESETEEIYSHEMEHYNKARELGLKPQLQIQFLVRDSGKLSMYPSVVAEFSDDMPLEEAKIKLRSMVEAPTELSPRDKAQIMGIE